MSFQRDFNDLLNEYLVACKNMSPIVQLDTVSLKADYPDIYNKYLVQTQPDTSVGSVLYMRAAALASMLYGLYKTCDKVVDQFFVTTALREYLERHAADLSVSSTNKIDSDLVDELLLLKQVKLMGGNKYDYVDWAKDAELSLVKSNPASTALSNSGFASFDAAAAVDGVTTAVAWSTDGVEADSSITVDCVATPRMYTKLKMYVSAASDDTYDVSYSSDGTTWISAGQLTVSLTGWNECSWTNATVYKYWKIALSNNPSSVSTVMEIELYEGPESVDEDGCAVYAITRGEGTFDVVIQSTLSNGIPSADLLAAVTAIVTDRRPVCSGFDWGLRVVAPALLLQNITMVGTGDDYDAESTLVDVISYVNSLKHGKPLYIAQLISIAIQNGADSAVVSIPAADVVPTVDKYNAVYQVVRAGTVSVT